MGCSPLGCSVHGIFQARILEQVAISFSRGSSRPWDRTCISCIGRWILCHWATRETIQAMQVFVNHSCSHSFVDSPRARHWGHRVNYSVVYNDARSSGKNTWRGYCAICRYKGKDMYKVSLKCEGGALEVWGWGGEEHSGKIPGSNSPKYMSGQIKLDFKKKSVTVSASKR